MKRTSGPRRIANLSGSVLRRLNSYALAASAAGVGVLALPPTADAKIIYTPAHAKVIINQPLALDLNHDGIIDFYLFQRATSEFFTYVSACQYVRPVSGGLACSSTLGMNSIRASRSKGNVYAAALKYGEMIQQGERFAPRRARLGGVATSGQRSDTYWVGPWLNGGKGVKNRYLGLKFEIKGSFHFGWARITVTTTKNRFTALLTGYAYETIPGKAIIAGATKGPDDELTTSFNTHAPQPATLGMLALGAPGLSIWKREESAGATTARN
jgi:hypothetical protein